MHRLYMLFSNRKNRPLCIPGPGNSYKTALLHNLVSYIERYDGINGMIRTDDFNVVKLRWF